MADYVNPAGNMAWVEFEQRINGLAGVPRPDSRRLHGPTASSRGRPASSPPGLDAAQLATAPTLTAAQAVSRAAANVGWSVAADALVQTAIDDGRVTFARGPMADEAKAWLLYFPLAPGAARLAWATEIWGDPDVFLILLDAEDGSVLFRKNLTNYQTQAATYRVYTRRQPGAAVADDGAAGPGHPGPVHRANGPDADRQRSRRTPSTTWDG